MKELQGDAPARRTNGPGGRLQRRRAGGIVDEAVVSSAGARATHRRPARDDQCGAAARSFRVKRRERRSVELDAQMHRSHDDAIGQLQRADRSGSQHAVREVLRGSAPRYSDSGGVVSE